MDGELSDHALMALVRAAPVEKPAGEVRPRPLPITAWPRNSRECALLEEFESQLAVAEVARELAVDEALRDDT